MQQLRIYLAALLLAVILSPTAYQTGYLAYFYANQASIAQKYCINKDKPQLKCNGKCHLAKQLGNDQSDQTPATVSFIETFSLIGVMTEIEAFQFDPDYSTHFFTGLQKPYKFLFSKYIFQPPRG